MEGTVVLSVLVSTIDIIEKMKSREKEIFDDNVVVETDESMGSGNVVKSQIIIATPNKDIFEVGSTDERGSVGPGGKVSSRVCEVKPLPRDNDDTNVSVEISKGNPEQLDSEND